MIFWHNFHLTWFNWPRYYFKVPISLILSSTFKTLEVLEFFFLSRGRYMITTCLENPRLTIEIQVRAPRICIIFTTFQPQNSIVKSSAKTIHNQALIKKNFFFLTLFLHYDKNHKKTEEESQSSNNKRPFILAAEIVQTPRHNDWFFIDFHWKHNEGRERHVLRSIFS